MTSASFAMQEARALGFRAENVRGKLQAIGLLAHGSPQPATHALLPLLEALGWRGDAHELAELLRVSPRHLSWGDLLNLVRALGYSCEQRKGTLRQLQATDLPCLFVPDDAAQTAYIILELTADGFMARALDEDCITPLKRSAQAGTISVLHALEEGDANVRPGQWFRTAVQKFRPQFRDGLLLGLFISLFALCVPLFTMLVYDRVIGGHDLGALWKLLFGVVVALVAEGAFRWLRGVSLSWFGVRINHLIAVTMFQRLFALDPLSLERAPVAAQMVRAKAMESVRDFLTGQSFILFIEFPFLPVLLLALLYLAPTMALACLLAGLVLAALLATQLRGIRRLSQRSARAMAERQRDALELFSKIDTLRAHGLTDQLYERFATSNRRAIAAAAAVNWRMQVVEHLVLAVSMAAGLAALVLGVQAVWAETLSPGGLIASMIIGWRILMPLQQLAAIAPRLEQVSGGIQQLEQLLQLPPERTEQRMSAPTHAVHGQLELVNLAMRYPRQPDAVFAGLSLNVNPGEVVAIAGANGSGKSSVLKMLNGMYAQAAGSIRLDGIDIRQIDPLSLRRGITYIAQAPALFSATVRENLTMAAPFAATEDITRALEQADALEDVLQLPEGLDTMLGEQGHQVPLALACKLNLARAYIAPKPLILCDELPYALLTSHAGVLFREQIAKLRGTHTIILVAHTSDLVSMADKAVYLQPNRRPVVGTPRDILPLMLEQTHGHLG
ncbi:MAG: hypothetical protein DI582_05595 [Azospirillum brasilense]|nr:MAG: hypothetical protein DI582_05595 [Azospirillum brasilense]